MSRVTSIVVRPTPGAVSRAAVGAVEITAASVAAHWIAGGVLPSANWVLASALPIFGVGVLLQRGRVSLRSALAGAAAAQVFLHLALVAGTSADHVHASGSAASMGPSMSSVMVVAHAVGALATILVWSVRRGLWDVLVRVSRVRIMAVRRLARRSMAGDATVDAWLQWMASRRRGPPGRVCV
jgi:hypothetical protein